MKKVLIILAVLILASIGGAYAITRNRTTVHDDLPPATSTNTPTTTPEATTPESSQNVITYTGSGFSPASLTVKSGAVVTIKNDSSIDLQFSSDDHPTHLKNPELNQSLIGPGKTQTFTPTTKGTWGYHNHQNNTDRGTIVVN